MTKLKDFLYLDTSLVNSIFSQYYEGLITTLTKANSEKDDLKGSIGFDLKLIKGNTGGTTGTESSQSETIDLHHFAYQMLEEKLIADGAINGSKKDIVMHSGDLRIVDAAKTIESFDGLKTLISGFDAAMKLANSTTKQNVIPQEMRNAAQKSKDISKLISQLSDNHVFAYIDDEKIALDRSCLVGLGSPEFTNNGKLFDGNYIVVGLNSKPSMRDDDSGGNGDILLSLSKAFSGFQDMMNVSPIKPIAIYRLIDEPNKLQGK